MSEVILSLSTDTGAGFGPRFQWHSEPESWTIHPEARSLVIRTSRPSDFWQRTHYGFQADDGHFLWTPIEHDFQMTVDVRVTPLHQYDQAGLMVRISADCWIKTSVEFEDGLVSRLGCVVTNRGYSDWSTQDVPATVTGFALRITRQSADYLVEAQLPGAAWSQLRMTHLDHGAATAAHCGVYACSPKEPGFTAEFHNFGLCPR